MTLHRRTVHAFLAVADPLEPSAARPSAGFATGKSVIETGKISAN